MMIKYFKNKLYPFVSKYIYRLCVVEGRLRDSDYTFRCLFIDNSPYSKYIQKRSYEGSVRVINNRRIWVTGIKKYIKNVAEYDLGIVVLPKILKSSYVEKCDFRSTHYIQQVIDTSGTWEEIRTKFEKSFRKKSNTLQEKYDLSYRLSTSLEEFDHFYYNMFVPHIKKRHGDLSVIDSYDKMKDVFNKGQLLLVLKEDKPIAGALFSIVDNILVFHRTGVLNGDDSFVKDRAQFALYYFQLKYAHENKLNGVDTKWSASMLNDGVFRHKRGWGASALPLEESKDWIYYYNVKPSDKMAKFFEINPLIYCGENGLEAVAGMAGDSDISADAINKYISKYKSDGINNYTVITPQNIIKLR